MNKYNIPYLSKMNDELANYIKDLRIRKKNCSWRRLASEVADKYPYLNICPGNQLEGIDLCRAAMFYLKEDYKDGW